MLKMTNKLILSIFLTLAFFVGPSYALSISYVAQDLTDTTIGEDLWQYEYSVRDHSFGVGQGFTIWFDYTPYGAIDPSPVSPNANWDVTTWDPDVNLFDDGAYDAMALMDNPSLADSFIVSFVWLDGGSTMPGSQYFELYDTNFSVIGGGDTFAVSDIPVPEPGTMMLFGVGLITLFALERKSKNSKGGNHENFNSQ